MIQTFGGRNARVGISLAFLLLASGCSLFDRSPAKNDIYDAIKNLDMQPFGVDGVACKSAGEASDCRFDATIITGHQTTGVADRRPEFKRVRMAGRFTKAGEKWSQAQIAVLNDPPTTN